MTVQYIDNLSNCQRRYHCPQSHAIESSEKDKGQKPSDNDQGNIKTYFCCTQIYHQTEYDICSDLKKLDRMKILF